MHLVICKIRAPTQGPLTPKPLHCGMLCCMLKTKTCLALIVINVPCELLSINKRVCKLRCQQGPSRQMTVSWVIKESDDICGELQSLPPSEGTAANQLPQIVIVGMWSTIAQSSDFFQKTSEILIFMLNLLMCKSRQLSFNILWRLACASTKQMCALDSAQQATFGKSSTWQTGRYHKFI